MQPLLAFFAGLALLLLVAAGALLIVQRPLVAILIELCGAEHRARFWSRLYGLSLFLLVALFALWVPPSSTSQAADFHDFLRTFRAGSLALLTGLGILGFFTMLSIAQHDRRARSAAWRHANESE